MPSVCLGSWNERRRLVCLAELRLLSRTVAAESMRHLTKSHRATGHRLRLISLALVQIWFLATPLRYGRRRVARCFSEC